MAKERAIDLQLIKPITPGSSGGKGKITLKNLFKIYFRELNVGFYDPCCDDPATCPPISQDPDNTLECRADGLYAATGGGGGTLTDATNGVSLSGTNVVLGQNIGDVSNPALLTSNREIPVGGNVVLFTGFTVSPGIFTAISRTSVSINSDFTNSQIGQVVIEDTTGAEIAMRVDGVGPNISSSYPNSSLLFFPSGNINFGDSSSAVDSGEKFQVQGSILTNSVVGSNAASGTLTLSSTSNATKGTILFGTSLYDETNNRLGINITPLYDIHVESATAISTNINTTAVSGTSGGKMYLYTKNLPSASNHELGSIVFGSRGGAQNEYVGANIRGVTNGAWTAGSNHQGAILFGITASGNSTPSTVMRLGSAGRLFVGGNTVATAFIHLAAGTAGASGAPLKFTTGSLMTTPETGAVEYDGTNLFFTRTGTTRESIFTGVSAASAPTTSVGGIITNRYGGDTNFLGDPNSWASVVIGGTTYKIPLYT